MRHINPYPAWPNGWHKMESGLGPLSGTLVEKYDARYVLDPNTLVGDATFGTPTILWINGNGTTPLVSPNPLLSLATVNVVTPNQPMPHQYPSGASALGEEYSGTSCRRDATHTVNPLDTDDIVVVLKHRVQSVALVGGTYYQLLGTRSTAGTSRGWFMCHLNNYMTLGLYGTGGNLTASATETIVRGSANITVAVVNRNGNFQVWHNTVSGLPAATPAGAFDGDGLALGAQVAALGFAGAGTRIEWAAVWYGAGLWETWTAGSNRLINLISSEAMGLRETVGRKLWSLSRDESDACSQDHDGRWWLFGRHAPRAGCSQGLYVGNHVHNEAASSFLGGGAFPRNWNPPDTVGWTATGGVITRVDDSAALLTAKAENWGPYVFQFVNATGSPQTVYCGAAGTLNARCSYAVLARYSAGAGAEIGYWDASAATFTALGTIADGYALTLAQDVVNAQNDWYFAIRIPTGCTLLFIGHTRADARRLDTPISCYNTTNRAVDLATTEHAPADASDSILARITPTGWSGTECGADVTMLTRATTPSDILHAESVAAGWARGDGTAQIQTVAPSVPTDGVRVDVWSAWKAALQYVQQGLAGTPVTGAYDGTQGGTGNLQATSDAGPYRLDYIEIRAV